ncbi:hypothetical protein FO519_003861 [Halicephalobus sp. NKZ332]|nr:hypothetical protein FO519_003861 [Halicephalobus sp. NKZ332]
MSPIMSPESYDKSPEKKLQFADLEESAGSGRSVSSSLSDEIDPRSLITKATPALVLAVIVACVGSSFVFGYALGETNVPSRYIQEWLNESHRELTGSTAEPPIDFIWSSSVSVFAIGAMIGSMISGFLADKLGWKGCLCFNNLFGILGSVLMFIAPFTIHYYLFHMGRWIIGLNAGIASSVVPMFVTELSPLKWRGAIGTLPQLMVTISILVSQGVGLIFNDRDRFQWIFAVTIIPCVFQVVGLFFVIESPKFTLTIRGDREKALSDLARLRNVDKNHPLVQRELELISREARAIRSEPKVRIFNLLQGRFIWPTFLACFLQAAQQLTGINAAMFYSTQIFEKSGLSGNTAIYATLGMGAANVLMTILSFVLVEKLGRRTLLLIGKTGMLIATIVLIIAIRSEIYWLCIVMVVFFVISFATGPGSIPFFYVSEVFASNVRASASALATATNWTCNVLVGLAFPPLQGLIHEFVFLFFAVFLLIAILVILMWLPETKGKSLEEVEKSMEKRKPKCF